MAQHRSRSAAFRDLSLSAINKLSEDEQIALLARLRWGLDGQQVCPKSDCGLIANHYWRKDRKQWRCRSCDAHFSVTSGTTFHAHKILLKQILVICFNFVTAASGESSLHMSHLEDFEYKTPWLNMFKLREAIIKSTRYDSQLEGVIHMDGAFFGGRFRAENVHGVGPNVNAVKAKIESPRTKRPMAFKRYLQVSANDSRNQKNRDENSRCVLVARDASPAKGEGSSRTRIWIGRNENQSEATAFAELCITPGSTVMTDEGAAFTRLSMTFDHRTVKHKREFVTKDGVNCNQAESFHSRVRRMQYGTIHGVRPKYLMDYACEMAWREDVRKMSLKARFEDLLSKALSSGCSTWWRKYYQGLRRIEIQGPADGLRFTRPHAEGVAMFRDELRRREKDLGEPVVARYRL